MSFFPLALRFDKVRPWSAGMDSVILSHYHPWSREIMYLVASVRTSVCPSAISQLNCLTYNLDFWHEGWHSWHLDITDYCHLPSRSKIMSRLQVKGQCQICGMQQSILGARLAEMVDYSQVWAKEDCYQSEEFVCVSVIKGLLWIISQTWSISF